MAKEKSNSKRHAARMLELLKALEAAIDKYAPQSVLEAVLE